MQVIARSLKARVSPWKSSRTDRPPFSRAIRTTSGTEKPDRASPTRTGREKHGKQDSLIIWSVLPACNGEFSPPAHLPGGLWGSAEEGWTVKQPPSLLWCRTAPSSSSGCRGSAEANSPAWTSLHLGHSPKTAPPGSPSPWPPHEYCSTASYTPVKEGNSHHILVWVLWHHSASSARVHFSETMCVFFCKAKIYKKSLNLSHTLCCYRYRFISSLDTDNTNMWMGESFDCHCTHPWKAGLKR